MTPPSRKTTRRRAPAAGRGAATRATDREDVALVLFGAAEAVLDAWAMDSDATDAYASWLRRVPSRQKGRKPATCTLIAANVPPIGHVTLTALPAAGKFAVTIAGDGFTAHVAATYDVETETMTDAALVGFSGDASLLEMFRELAEQGRKSDFDAPPASGPDPSGAAPPKSTTADARYVARMARACAHLRSSGKPFDLPEDDRSYLEETPQSLRPIIDGTLAAMTAAKRDENLVVAHLWLLERQLELIRYRLERGWAWAKEVLDAFQNRLVTLSERGDLSVEDWYSLVGALQRAKVPLNPEINTAAVQSGDAEAAALASDPADQMRAALAEIGAVTDDPFFLMESIGEAIAAGPAAMRMVLAQEMAGSDHAVLREATALMLLDAASEVRQSAAAALERTAWPASMSPETLRRIITLRNWVPEADRPELDRAVRAARGNGVVCASWSAATDLRILVSAIDGSGAQSIIATNRTGRAGLFAGLLLKLQFGIRDVWFETGKPRREINRLLAEVQAQTPSIEADRAYLDRAVQHALAVGLARGTPPSPDLLAIAEAVGAADWKDRRIDVPAEAEALFATLPESQRSESGIAASFARSGGWMSSQAFAESWFEDDADIRAAVTARPRRNGAGAVQEILEGPLAKHRGVWAERFLLMAEWARLAPQARLDLRWQDFAVLAHEMWTDRKLADIPIMAEIAERSVAVALSPRW